MLRGGFRRTGEAACRRMTWRPARRRIKAMSQTPETGQPPRKRRWLRFSLRTLVIFVLLAGSGFGLWYRWEPWTVEFERRLEQQPYDAEFSPDGHHFFILYDRSAQTNARAVVTLWDTLQAKEIYRKEPPWSPSFPVDWGPAEFSPDGRWLFYADQAGVQAWSTDTGQPFDFGPVPVKNAELGYSRVQFSLDGRRALLLSSKGHVLDLEHGRWLADLALHPDEHGVYGAISPDGAWVAGIGSGWKALQLWDVDGGKMVWERPEPKGVNVLLFTPDSRGLLVEHFGDVSTHLLEVANGKELFEFEGGRAEFSHDGKRLLTRRELPGAEAWDVWLWDVPSRKYSFIIRVDSVDFWPAFTSDDSGIEVHTNGSARVLDLRHGMNWRWFDAGGLFSHDGRRLLTREAGGAQIWDVPSQRIVWEMKEESHTARWHPDGRHVLTTPLLGSERCVRLWALRRPEQWWGVLVLPEFWMTVLFAGALAWSVWRDRRTL